MEISTRETMEQAIKEMKQKNKEEKFDANNEDEIRAFLYCYCSGKLGTENVHLETRVGRKKIDISLLDKQGGRLFAEIKHWGTAKKTWKKYIKGKKGKNGSIQYDIDKLIKKSKEPYNTNKSHYRMILVVSPHTKDHPDWNKITGKVRKGLKKAKNDINRICEKEREKHRIDIKFKYIKLKRHDRLQQDGNQPYRA